MKFMKFDNAMYRISNIMRACIKGGPYAGRGGWYEVVIWTAQDKHYIESFEDVEKAQVRYCEIMAILENN